MAKRSGAGNLAGLAGLAALGYMALKGRKGDAAPVEDRMGKPVDRPSDSGEYDPVASGDWSYGEQGMMAKEPDWESKVAPPKAAAPKAAAPKAAAPKPFAGTAMPMSQRDAVRQADLAMQSKPSASDDVVTSRKARLAEEAKRPLAERQAEAREQFLKNSPLFSGLKSTSSQSRTPAVDSRAARLAEEAKRPLADRQEEERQKFLRDSPLFSTFRAIRERGESGPPTFKKGGAVKKMASGGVTRSSASKRADGIATKGKTRGKMY